MKQYRSKISVGLLVFIALTFVIIGCGMFVENISWLAISLSLLLPFILIVLIFTLIKYQIDADMLHIKAFPFFAKIPIKSITKITRSRSILSAPAASLDRMKIYYNKYDYTLVSPKNKQQFIADLLAINPDIEVEM